MFAFLLASPLLMLNAYRLQFEELGRATDVLLAAVAALPNPSAPAPDGGWSGVQVVRHLCGAENSIAALLEKQSAKSASTLPTTGLKNWFRSRLMSWLLRRPDRRFVVPTRLEQPVVETVPVEALRHEWATVRQRLGRVLAAFPPTHTGRAVFKHPRAGWLTLGQTLRFLLDHVQHHQQQVGRLAAVAAR